jgi:DNA methyltransferase 1-associated protein 1
LESLIDATTLLLETKKNVDKVEQDIRVMKAKVLRRDGQLGGEGGEPMDVDQEPAVDDDDVGNHAGRSVRKKNVSPPKHEEFKVKSADTLASQTRRSMSISSVDTAAQPGRSNKRQKQG